MAVTDRKPNQRIGRIQPGQPIRAAFLNALVDGTNELLAGIDPPKSLKRPIPQNQINEVSNITTGERRFVQVSKVVTVINIECPNDPTVNFDVERIDEITFMSNDEMLTLVFDWS